MGTAGGSKVYEGFMLPEFPDGQDHIHTGLLESEPSFPAPGGPSSPSRDGKFRENMAGDSDEVLDLS